MSIDRQGALRRAEALIEQGQFAAAIDEYATLAAANPADWATLNLLGDLYVRTGRAELAVPLYARVADHYLVEGFHARAAGYYKKILKFTPHDEDARLKLARACAQQGLRLDARRHLDDVVAARRGRGDSTGAAAALAIIAELEAGAGDSRGAAGLFVVADQNSREGETRHRGEEPGEDGVDETAIERWEEGPHSGRPITIEIDLTPLVDALASVVPLTHTTSASQAAEQSPPSTPSLDSALAALRERSSPGAQDLVALGRTYASAGMHSEAAEAFEAAAHDPSRRYEAAVAMVDLCAVRQDQAGLIDWLECATEAAPTPAKRGAALYRLGLALEQSGELARALAIWLELQSLAPAFRDVGARVARLQGTKNGGAP